ncbi:phospholipid carrier-dependent glycosyltransferase [Leucobacter tenebrionis]|uniref:phospholipid carrier-dependent glycosyltransferase n=1 Tax=Leucobacter tenebrionis TaxID=2873270 RepID=UPI0021050DAF|nr:phospholipid carrier-dependent glycosyltransferase [Leucobacter tenebrionis]
MRGSLRWIAPALVLGIAAVLRFWALDRPGVLVFDELYYVRDAISQLAHGFPTVWADDDPSMAGARATAFSDAPSNAVHPPLGKWLIGIGILIFGPDNGWGWRSAVALAGVTTVAVVMRLGWLLSRSILIACTAGLLLAIDGVHVVLTRVALLDGFLTLFVALGALFVWRDMEWGSRRGPLRGRILIWRPWLFAAGLAFGAAAAVKWSGLYPLAFFLVFVTVRDLLERLRRGERGAVGWAALQAGVSAVIALPTAALAYLVSWAGWILHPGGWARTPGTPWPAALLEYHAEMLSWHSTLTAEHPYQSHPLTWPLALVPTAMYEARSTKGCVWHECVSGISPLPNPLITWGGVVALCVLMWWVLRAFLGSRGRFGIGPEPGRAEFLGRPGTLAGAFVLIGYLSGWLPWVLTFSRSAVFQFYAVVLTPFSALALALVLGALCGIPIRSSTEPSAPRPLDPTDATLLGRRISVLIFLITAVLLAVLFFPVWSGMPIADWFWQMHMWLPGWS